MRSRLFLTAAAGAALFLSSLPGFAIETVTVPQLNSDGTPAYQDPDAQGQSKFSTDQQGDTKVDGLGSFHFSVNSDQNWPAGSGYNYLPGYSSQPGYGTNNAPGSEFYNSGYPFPH
ncbi:MAG TPA: hypothetical protein VHU23_07400 [Rhizomicrobium sp.]|jgi:hypothetical protein|nr:hypothetical protein [Rhizomicrobium sp.]